MSGGDRGKIWFSKSGGGWGVVDVKGGPREGVGARFRWSPEWDKGEGEGRGFKKFSHSMLGLVKKGTRVGEVIWFPNFTVTGGSEVARSITCRET